MIYIQALTYLSIMVFVIAIIARAIRIIKSPIHLRWEIYPVPHEKGRADYGGSVLEEVNWWKKEFKKDHVKEIKEMAEEILFLKGVKEHNPSLWAGSFPFHLALYFYAGFTAILTVISVLNVFGVNTLSGNSELWETVLTITTYIALAGTIIGVLGSARMMFLRIVDSGMRLYSSVSHYFNILLIGAMFFTAMLWIDCDSDFALNASLFISGVITFSTIPSLPALGILNILFTLVFLLYLPFTHMTHFFTKYFIYHKVRWEDEPNLNGSKMQDEIAKLLNQPVTWAAPHIGADGKKTWLAITTDIPSSKVENK